MEYLNSLDAAFLEVEDADPHVALAIGTVTVLDGPAPAQAELLAVLGRRLVSVPRFGQRVRRTPMDVTRPEWVDDPAFDLSYHVRRAALPAPGDDDALCRLVARVMALRLDRDWPLWECWVVEGLAGGRWAVVMKVHHCLADGMSGRHLYDILTDSVAAATRRPVTAPPQLRARPRRRVVVGTVNDVLTLPLRLLRSVLGVIGGAQRLATELLTPAAATSLTGPRCTTSVRSARCSAPRSTTWRWPWSHGRSGPCWSAVANGHCPTRCVPWCRYPPGQTALNRSWTTECQS